MVNYTKKELVIVFGATGNMAFALGNVFLALKKNSPSLNADVIVFEQKIALKDKEILNSILPCNFTEYNFPDKKCLTENTLKRFSELTFSRFECFNLLNEYKKVLWLDIDILIQHDIQQLLDECSEGISLASGDKNASDFEIEIENIPHYNAGIIYLQDNLPNYKELTDWCYEKTIEYAQYLTCADQGIINLMIKEHNLKVHWLHWKYNFNPAYGGNTDNCVIVHTFCSEKFWNYWNFEEWNKNYQKWMDLGGSPYINASFKFIPKVVKKTKNYLTKIIKKFLV